MHITEDTVQTKEVTIETQNKMTSPIEGESRRPHHEATVRQRPTQPRADRTLENNTNTE
jgi:hypothetical protein